MRPPMAIRVVKLLLEKGAKTETKDGDDKTALIWRQNGNTES